MQTAAVVVFSLIYAPLLFEAAPLLMGFPIPFHSAVYASMLNAFCVGLLIATVWRVSLHDGRPVVGVMILLAVLVSLVCSGLWGVLLSNPDHTPIGLWRGMALYFMVNGALCAALCLAGVGALLFATLTIGRGQVTGR
ncbi:MAG: hypothetical protein GC154_20605 [bacterium]|nr:hypothetical protein [bacterium]